MKKQKTYTTADLFHTSWADLKPETRCAVYAIQQTIDQLDGLKYGLALINILKLLIKNQSLVNKINEEQAVDIYNDLKFLNEPWYDFPDIAIAIANSHSPSPKLANTTFDQFIYADNEFTSFIHSQDEKYLYRLVVTLYTNAFDKEQVEANAAKLTGKVPLWQLQLVFFTFGHVREFVIKRCKHLLPRAPKMAGEDDLQQKPQPTGPMWYAIKHQLARTHVFGTFDETGRSNMYSCLDHLELLCKEKEDAKSKTH